MIVLSVFSSNLHNCGYKVLIIADQSRSQKLYVSFRSTNNIFTTVTSFPLVRYQLVRPNPLIVSSSRSVPGLPAAVPLALVSWISFHLLETKLPI